MKLWPVLTGVAIALTLVACKSPTPPKGVQPISGFDAGRYLGKWYEVARLENRFERGLEQVTATYGKRSDDGISVLNRGYDQFSFENHKRKRCSFNNTFRNSRCNSICEYST